MLQTVREKSRFFFTLKKKEEKDASILNCIPAWLVLGWIYVQYNYTMNVHKVAASTTSPPSHQLCCLHQTWNFTTNVEENARSIYRICQMLTRQTVQKLSGKKYYILFNYQHTQNEVMIA